ncbi:MAG: extracellular solute-binding protein [Armatimonadota bacterium]|nr:extracellular solute-binding protein [Armatimonadota bacterium]
MAVRQVRMWLTLGLATVLGASTVLGAWAGPGSPLQALVEAARREGRVVMYDGTGGAVPTFEYATKLLQERYGIRGEYVVMRASEQRERVRVEVRTGRVLGDALGTGHTTTWGMKFEDASLESFSDRVPSYRRVSPQVRLLMERMRVSGEIAPTVLQIWGILVNTNLVPPAEEPRSWMDLLDPKWRGRFIMDDPRALGGGFVFFSATLKQLGRRYHEALAAQRPILTRSIADAANRVARGEVPMMAPFAVGLYARLADQGLPLKLILAREGAPYVVHGISIPKGAPHPNAAVLLTELMLAEEVQLRFAEDYLVPVIPGVVRRAPERVRAVVGARLWDTTEPERSAEWLRLAAEIYR